MKSAMRTWNRACLIGISFFTCITFAAAAIADDPARTSGNPSFYLAATGDTGDAPPPPDTAYTRPLEEAMAEVIQTLQAIAAEPGLSPDDQRQKAMEFVKNYRYGPENKDYFWINDLQGQMLMHPINENLNGKVVTNVRDSQGKLLFVEMIQKSLEEGKGTVTFQEAKPGEEEPVTKIALVQLFAQWGWVIGTGWYPENIEAYDEMLGEFEEPDPLPPFDDRIPASQT